VKHSLLGIESKPSHTLQNGMILQRPSTNPVLYAAGIPYPSSSIFEAVWSDPAISYGAADKAVGR
jgi:hypothetical protein